MKLAILNTSIITTCGNYSMTPLLLAEVKALISMNDILSAIGHESTADILSTILEIDVPVNRITFIQEVGQQALIFKLKTRAPEGVILTLAQLKEIGFDFFLLTRTA